LRKWLVVIFSVPALVLMVRAATSAGNALAPDDAAQFIKETKDLQLIDVRTPGEYADHRLVGAKLIPLQELGARVHELDGKKPILLYCRSGSRSAKAIDVLERHGITGAKHIDGGIRAWQAAGLPLTHEP
jgi:rhodanese-related sulfurtransferase